MKKFERLVWKMIGEDVHLELEGTPLQGGDHVELLLGEAIVSLEIIGKKGDSCAISFSAVTLDSAQDVAYLLKEGQLVRRNDDE